MCTFAWKSHQAALGGAKAIIVVNTEDEDDVTPTADSVEDEALLKTLVPLLMVGNTSGTAFEKLLMTTSGREFGGAVLSVTASHGVEDENEPINLGGYVVSNVKLKRN